MSCDYCKATSHREEECRKKIYDIKVCDYCNIRGHTHGECYALSRVIREGRVNKQTIDNSVAQAPPVSQQPVVYCIHSIRARIGGLLSTDAKDKRCKEIA